ncbi:MAG: TatD family hydrolase [Clostridiales bacterium]|nr:TatD family hydrolase [Clostridiales bacterium]
MRIFDTHAHISDKRFDEDRDALITEKLLPSPVELVLDVACDLRDVSATLALIDRYDMFYGVFGMHPHTAVFMDAEKYALLASLLKNKKTVALGEIGLDYYYDLSPRDVQRKVFDEQLSLAEELKLPVVLHIRDAMGDTMDILRAHRAALTGIGGVMHCYSGSAESAKECLDMGLYLGFGGSLTFKNNRRGVETAQMIPLDRFVFETDCPYLAPVPHRGERNDPTFIPFVAEKFAEIRGISPEEACEAAFVNGCRLFGLSPVPAAENGRNVYRRL